MEIKYFFCILQFTDDADSVGGNSLESLTAKDLTKYVYGVAKGMEYIVSKGVRILYFTRNMFYKKQAIRDSQVID